MVGIIITQIWASQPMLASVMNLEIKLPKTIPPGNHMWNRFNILLSLVPSYISAIIGLHAASVHPFPKPINKVEINKVVYPSA